VEEIRARKPEGSKILEIGAGTGYQAKQLSRKGYHVQAIDVGNSNYLDSRIWPITNYDGKHIPFPDNTFDVLFSSSVLEHIQHLDQFHTEMKRVLKPDGIAIHVVPVATWRFWSNLTHYLQILKLLFLVTRNKIALVFGYRSSHAQGSRAIKMIKKLSPKELIIRTLLPPRHGEKGNFISEIHHFRKRKWISMFENNGWSIERARPNKLFYTGYLVFGSALPLKSRELLARILGSCCYIFVLTMSDNSVNTGS
jgi:SAM-dependent methyltransferase